MPNTIFQDIKDMLTILTPVALAIIAYKQIKMSIKQSIIHKQIDGMKSELVEAVGGRRDAEGQLKGMEKARQDTISDTAAKVISSTITEVQKVEVVGQAKPVVVEVKKED